MAMQLSTNKPVSPEWLTNVLVKYQTGEGHAFLLSGAGNHDIDALTYTVHANLWHVFGNHSLPTGETKRPKLDFDIVVRYDRFEGFRFIGTNRENERKIFKQIVERTGSSSSSGGGIGGIRGGISSPNATEGADILDRSKNPASAIGLIKTALAQTDYRICLIIDEFQSICPRGDWDKFGENQMNAIIAFRTWGLDYENIGGHGSAWRNKGNKIGHLIFGIADDRSEVHSIFSRGRSQSGWIPVNIGFPTYPERLYFIQNKFLTPEYLERVDIDFGESVPEAEYSFWLAKATGGLSIRSIEDMMLVGELRRVLTRDDIQTRINNTISEQFSGSGGSDYLQVINPSRGLDGYGVPKYLASELQFFLRRFQQGKLRNSNMLMAGPPGTGKSVIANALAFELGYKCVQWSPALTQSKWVGETEQQLQKVLNWVEANLPCALFVDEIDVAMTSRDGGAVDTSGVGSKMLSILMPWLEQDHIKGQLLFIAATNRPDNIDAALKRRLQTVIPVLPPSSAEERSEVIRNILLREQNVVSVEDSDIPAEVCDDAVSGWYTQANLSILVDRAATIAARDGAELDADIAGYLRRAASTYRVDTTRTEAMSYLAAAQASNTELLPPGFVVKSERDAKRVLKEVESPADEDYSVGPSGRGGR